MEFKNNPYLTIREKIELLQRWVIVHSIVYYQMDTSIATDKQFDDNAYQLVELMRSFPQEAKRSRYFYCMNNFNGSTGFDLYSKLKREDADKLWGDATRICQIQRRISNAR